MSAPAIFVVIPMLIGIALTLFNQYRVWVYTAGIALATVLPILAWFLPVGQVISFRNIAFVISSTMTILGRQFTIDQNFTGIVAFLYAVLCLWLVAAFIFKLRSLFPAFSLIFISLLIAGLSVQPWLFSAVFYIIGILIFVPVLSPNDTAPSPGLIRFISFQAIGVPLILLSGAMLVGLESSPMGLPVVIRPSLFLGIGFAFVLGLFPFHAWIPRIAEDTHPLLSGFLFVFIPTFFTIFVLEIIDQYAWLRNSVEMFTLIRLIGVLTTVAGGIWTMVQRHLGRIFGYLAVTETGFLLVAIGSGATSPTLLFPLLFVRAIGYLAISCGIMLILNRKSSLRFRDIQGIGREIPLEIFVMFCGLFSSAGLPLTVGFVAKMLLYEALGFTYPTIKLALFIGSAGILFGVTRTLAVTMMIEARESEGDDEKILVSGESGQKITRMHLVRSSYLAVIGIMIILLGFIPNWLSPFITRLPLAFTHLIP